jgi:glycosyltransferase involved in cell wall biosynthesis
MPDPAIRFAMRDNPRLLRYLRTKMDALKTDAKLRARMSLLDSAHPLTARLLGPLLDIRGRMVRQALRRAMASQIGPQAPSRAKSGSLHIAYLANSPLPTRAANCVHVFKMCNAFQSRGYRTTLLAARSGQHFDQATLFDDFGVEPFDLSLLDSPHGSLAMEVARIEKGLRRGATHFFGRSLIGSYAASLIGVPALLERHLPLKGSEYAIAMDLFSRPSFRGLVVISDALKQWYQDRFPNIAGRIRVLPDAADPATEGGEAFPFEPVEGAALRAGYAGHLYPGKGAEIIAALAKTMPHVGFHVLGGDDAGLAHWRNMTAGQRNIVFYGFRPQRDVSAFLRGADVLLAPYQRQVRVHGGGEVSSWMSPLKIFEAMAHAKPIVSSDLPVLREILTHEVNALLCDPDDIGSWVAAIERLGNDQDLRARLSDRARLDFEADYTWAKRAEAIVGLLTEEGWPVSDGARPSPLS